MLPAASRVPLLRCHYLPIVPELITAGLHGHYIGSYGILLDRAARHAQHCVPDNNGPIVELARHFNTHQQFPNALLLANPEDHQRPLLLRRQLPAKYEDYPVACCDHSTSGSPVRKYKPDYLLECDRRRFTLEHAHHQLHAQRDHVPQRRRCDRHWSALLVQSGQHGRIHVQPDRAKEVLERMLPRRDLWPLIRPHKHNLRQHE